MTNAEKFLKDGVDIKQMATEMVDYFNFPPYEGIGESSIEEFFDKEVKPTLTEDERVILRSMNKNASIWREKGKLWIYCEGNLFNEDTFQFIKERRRI